MATSWLLGIILVWPRVKGVKSSTVNSIGIAVRMALQLKLNLPHARQVSQMSSAEFMSMECSNRLMWAMFVSDAIYAFDDNGQLNEEHVASMNLPCNIWSFTQGTPSSTLQMSQISQETADTSLRQATNPCAYLIKILAIRRTIIK